VGLGERSKVVSEAMRTVARAWAWAQAASDKAELEDDRVRAGSAPPEGRATRAGRARRRGSWETAGLGLPGGWGYGSSLEQSGRWVRGVGATGYRGALSPAEMENEA
jgi:hypothetical protein